MVQERTEHREGTERALGGNGVIDLSVLSEIIRSRPTLIIATIVVALALSILYLHVTEKKYAVKMEITAASSPVQEAGGGLRALSSIAGISLGSEGSSQFRVYLGTLRSPVAAEALETDQDLLRQIFPRDWSAAEGRWREPPSRLRPILRPVAKFFGFTVVPWSPPSTNRIFDYLERELKIIPDSKSGVVTLEIDSDKPTVGARVLIVVNDAIDDLMRKRDLAHAGIYIDYLTKRLSTVSVDDYRKPLISNLAEQEKTRMQASAPLPYVSDILGKPMISSKPVSPSPIATLLLGIILGGIFGLGLASIGYYRRWNFGIWPRTGGKSVGIDPAGRRSLR